MPWRNGGGVERTTRPRRHPSRHPRDRVPITGGRDGGEGAPPAARSAAAAPLAPTAPPRRRCPSTVDRRAVPRPRRRGAEGRQGKCKAGRTEEEWGRTTHPRRHPSRHPRDQVSNRNNRRSNIGGSHQEPRIRVGGLRLGGNRQTGYPLSIARAHSTDWLPSARTAGRRGGGSSQGTSVAGSAASA